MRGKRWDEAKLREAALLRDQNLPLRAISDRTGIPISTLGDNFRGVGEVFYELACKRCGAEMFSVRSDRLFCDDCKRRDKAINRREAIRRQRQLALVE